MGNYTNNQRLNRINPKRDIDSKTWLKQGTKAQEFGQEQTKNQIEH